VRTFVALNLTDAARSGLHAALAPLRETSLPLRWLDPTTLHVTIRFLGETAADSVPRIEEVLRSAAQRRTPIDLRISGVGAFPSLRRANIVWVGVAADEQLSALYRELEPALSRLGFPREQRPFRPHITVGRVRGSARPPDIERVAGRVQCEAVEQVQTVDLMRSWPGPEGSRYETLLKCRLGGGA